MNENDLENVLIQIGTQEFKDVKGLMVRLFSELLGTFIHITILLAGTGPETSPITNALASGFLLSSVITVHGHVSGGFVNPAITVGAWICGHIKLLVVFCYIAAQTIGAIVGVYVARLLRVAPDDSHGSWVPQSASSGLNMWVVFGLETLFTFVLVAVVVRTMDPKKSPGGFAGALAIGISITAALCAVPNYKASMNPVTALANAIYNNDFKHQWALWIGPMIGVTIAGLIYKFLFSQF